MNIAEHRDLPENNAEDITHIVLPLGPWDPIGSLERKRLHV
jgi:hypothetical protein